MLKTILMTFLLISSNLHAASFDKRIGDVSILSNNITFTGSVKFIETPTNYIVELKEITLEDELEIASLNMYKKSIIKDGDNILGLKVKVYGLHPNMDENELEKLKSVLRGQDFTFLCKSKVRDNTRGVLPICFVVKDDTDIIHSLMVSEIISDMDFSLLKDLPDDKERYSKLRNELIKQSILE
jgi:hypothetical protein